jgi:hypothetical protein
MKCRRANRCVSTLDSERTQQVPMRCAASVCEYRAIPAIQSERDCSAHHRRDAQRSARRRSPSIRLRTGTEPSGPAGRAHARGISPGRRGRSQRRTCARATRAAVAVVTDEKGQLATMLPAAAGVVGSRQTRRRAAAVTSPGTVMSSRRRSAPPRPSAHARRANELLAAIQPQRVRRLRLVTLVTSTSMSPRPASPFIYADFKISFAHWRWVGVRGPPLFVREHRVMRTHRRSRARSVSE